MKDPNLSISNFRAFFNFVLKVILIALLLGLCFDYGFTRIVVLGSDGGPAKVNRLTSKTYANEIPILGSSRAEGSFVPVFLGDSFFNYGLAGTHPIVWIFLLEKELEKKKNTPIIINFDFEGFGENIGDVSNYILNYPETSTVLKDESSAVYVLPFFRYFGHYDKILKYRLNEYMNLTKKTDNGGSFYLNPWSAKQRDRLVLERINSRSSFKIDPEQVEKLFSLVRSTDRKIIFVVAPYHSSYFEKFDNLNQATGLLYDLKLNNNVYVFDLSTSLQQDSLFYNTSHLSYSGAVSFSKNLKDSLIVYDLVE
jgi:hypothetical protein